MTGYLTAIKQAYRLFKSDSQVDTALAVLLVIGVLLPFIQQFHRSKANARRHQ